MALFIHAIAGAGRGFEAPYEGVISRIEDIPIKDYASAGQRRRFGRLAKLVYVAASRALQQTGIEALSTLPIVTGTALGEATVTLELLTQIHETAGATISPSLVPNSVHNSPAAYLSIGLGDRQPSVTVSQGWLSAHAALVAAEDYLSMGIASRALVVVGDEADPAWIDRLTSRGADDLARNLNNEAMQENAVALVVGLHPGGQRLGRVHSTVVATCDPCSSFHAALREWCIELDSSSTVVFQGLGPVLADIEAAATRQGAVIERPGPGLGTSAGGALACLAEALGKERKSLVSVAAELGELGVLHWSADNHSDSLEGT